MVLFGVCGAGSGTSGDASGFGGEALVGDPLTAANGFGFACHLVMMRKIGRQLDPSMATAILFVQGRVMIALWSGPSVEAPHLKATLAWPIVGFAIYSVLASTVLTYLLNTWALRHTQSSNVALYINVQPIIAASLNWYMGAPPPGHRFFVAVALTSFGLWLQTRRAVGGFRARIPSPARTLVIHDPKHRTITAVPFADRVVHHALIGPLEPHFDRWVNPHSFACRRAGSSY